MELLNKVIRLNVFKKIIESMIIEKNIIKIGRLN